MEQQLDLSIKYLNFATEDLEEEGKETDVKEEGEGNGFVEENFGSESSSNLKSNYGFFLDEQNPFLTNKPIPFQGEPTIVSSTNQKLKQQNPRIQPIQQQQESKYQRYESTLQMKTPLPSFTSPFSPNSECQTQASVTLGEMSKGAKYENYQSNLLTSFEQPSTATSLENFAYQTLESSEGRTFEGEGEPFSPIKKGAEKSGEHFQEEKNTNSFGVEWNAEFQDILSMENDEEDKKSEKLAAIIKDFHFNARKYGELIISEKHVPCLQKTIKPVTIGGVAGGDKYIVNGMLFKFAQDIEIAPGKYLYGGKRRDDHLAQKSVGHELKAMTSLFEILHNSQVCHRLRVSLFCRVDFKGYRLSVQSWLPIGKGSLIYGSEDGGKTYKSNNLQANKMMQFIGEQLYLKPHVVVDKSGQQHVIVGPGDIEIHKVFKTLFPHFNSTFFFELKRGLGGIPFFMWWMQPDYFLHVPTWSFLSPFFTNSSDPSS